MSNEVKYRSPNSLSREPYGTLWREFDDNKGIAYFIQTSSNEEEPDWVPLGDFLESVLADDLMRDEVLLQEYLTRFTIKKCVGASRL